MKKIFSLIALACAFAACQPEEVVTTFKPGKAVVDINVTCKDILTGATVTPSLNSTAGAVSGQTVTIEGEEGKVLPAQDVTVTASFEGKTYSETVKVAALRAGGKATYAVIIVVGTPMTDYTITTEDTAVPETAIAYFDKAEIEYSHNGVEKWAFNDTDYLLSGTVDYTVKTGVDGASVAVDVKNSGFKSVVDSYADLYKSETVKTEDDQIEFVVSAWAYYTVYQTYTKNIVTKSVYAEADGKKDLVGTVTYTEWTSTAAEYTETGNPLGHGHYEFGHGVSHGHGHGHGEDANAGGGIVLPE